MGFYEFLITKLQSKKGAIPSLASKSGVKNTTIHSWITYGVIPPIDKAEKVLNAMGYEIEIKEQKKD